MLGAQRMQEQCKRWTKKEPGYETNKHVATVLEENEISNISKNSFPTNVFPTFNVSKKWKERNGVGLIAKDLNGRPRSPNKKCTLRRHPPEDYDDPIVQPNNALLPSGKGRKFH